MDVVQAFEIFGLVKYPDEFLEPRLRMISRFSSPTRKQTPRTSWMTFSMILSLPTCDLDCMLMRTCCSLSIMSAGLS